MKAWWLAKVGKLIGILALSLIVLGVVVMMLWNAIIPDVFQGSTLTFPQAVGLLLLSHILLRGWGPWRYANGWRRDRWKHRFEEKLASLSPEEQERFKEEWRRRCGWTSGPEHSPEKAR
jgi:hypothetical protein